MNSNLRRLATFTLFASLAPLASCQRHPAGQPPGPATSAASAAVPAARTTPTTGSDVAPPPGVLRAYVWDCDGGQVLRMRNLFRENAIALDVHEGTRKLPHVVSADGAKYEDDVIVFWTRGGEATFLRKGGPAVKCRENRAASLLADARARGVTYRAQGNEPGWTLEVGPGDAMAWETNYGQQRHVYSSVQASGDPATGITFTARDDSTTLRVGIVHAKCLDDMSGQSFDYQVVLDAGSGRSYKGCATKP